MKTQCALCGRPKRSFEAQDYYCGRCDKIAGDVEADLAQELSRSGSLRAGFAEGKAGLLAALFPILEKRAYA